MTKKAKKLKERLRIEWLYKTSRLFLQRYKMLKETGKIDYTRVLKPENRLLHCNLYKFFTIGDFFMKTSIPEDLLTDDEWRMLETYNLKQHDFNPESVYKRIERKIDEIKTKYEGNYYYVSALRTSNKNRGCDSVYIKISGNAGFDLVEKQEDATKLLTLDEAYNLAEICKSFDREILGRLQFYGTDFNYHTFLHNKQINNKQLELPV